MVKQSIDEIPLAMGAIFDAQPTEDCMEMSAKEAKANGVQVTLALMLGNSSDIVLSQDFTFCK